MDAKIALRMTEHIRSLAAEHDVRVTWIKSWHAAISFDKTRHVYIPIIRRPSDYLFCLHELGHVVSEDSRKAGADGWDKYAEVLSEGAAWAWAAANAKPSLRRHLRAKDWNRVAYAFRTYLASSKHP